MAFMAGGIRNMGTQMPPMAAMINTEMAPKEAAWSCVPAMVPTKIPNEVAASAVSPAVIINSKMLVPITNLGKPNKGMAKIPTKIIKQNWNIHTIWYADILPTME